MPRISRRKALRTGNSARPLRAQRRAGEERVEGFRAPGDPASTAELLKFLFDRTGYIKQLEAGRHARGAGPHREPARTGERCDGLARPRRDAQRVPRSRRTGERSRRLRRELAHHADDAARGQGPGVPAGVSGRPGRGLVPTFAHIARARRHRGRAPPVLRRHDARHG